MKTIGACFMKIGGSVRLALVQEDDNGLKSVVPVGGAFAPFACAAGTANNMDAELRQAPATNAGDPPVAPTKRVGMVVHQTPGNMFDDYPRNDVASECYALGARDERL